MYCWAVGWGATGNGKGGKEHPSSQGENVIMLASLVIFSIVVASNFIYY